MTIIQLPDEQAAALRAKAAAQGLTLEDWFAQLAAPEDPAPSQKYRPLKTGRGMLSQYGPAPSDEDIEENRRDMFRNFAKDI